MKNIWLIGSSEGIGRELALELGVDKNNFLILSARNQNSLNNLAKDIAAKTLLVPLDVTKEDSILAALELIKNHNKQVDIIIYLAGYYEPMSAASIKMAEVEKMISINLTGAIRVVNSIIPDFIERKQGHIVLIGSVAGYIGLPNAVGYSASKSGLINFAENLKCDLDRYGIKVQIINPGFVKTRLTDKNNFKMPFIISARQAAKNIIKIIQSNKFEVNFPFIFANFIKLLSKLPYWLYFKIVNVINRN